MKYKTIVAGLVSILLSSTATGACTADNNSNLTASTAQDEATIELDESSIDPDYVTVRQGALITFENDKDTTESIYSKGEPRFDNIKAIAPDEEITLVLHKPGVYKFYCSDDKDRVGKIEVLADDKLSRELENRTTLGFDTYNRNTNQL